jgi:hypothetical protein
MRWYRAGRDAESRERRERRERGEMRRGLMYAGKCRVMEGWQHIRWWRTNGGMVWCGVGGGDVQCYAQLLLGELPV